MPEPLPKKAYVIRTADGRPVCFDPDLQIDKEKGIATEVTFLDRERAIFILDKFQKQLRKEKSKVRFKLVEIDLDPGKVEWALDAEDIHERAMKEAQA